MTVTPVCSVTQDKTRDCPQWAFDLLDHYDPQLPPHYTVHPPRVVRIDRRLDELYIDFAVTAPVDAIDWMLVALRSRERDEDSVVCAKGSYTIHLFMHITDATTKGFVAALHHMYFRRRGV